LGKFGPQENGGVHSINRRSKPNTLKKGWNSNGFREKSNTGKKRGPQGGWGRGPRSRKKKDGAEIERDMRLRDFRKIGAECVRETKNKVTKTQKRKKKKKKTSRQKKKEEEGVLRLIRVQKN